MQRSETAQLLGLMSTFDSRTTGEADVAAWADLMAATALQDAVEAVKTHYRQSTNRIMPADVLKGVQGLRKGRLERADATFEPDCDPDDTTEYMRQLRQHRTQIADGVEPQTPKELPVVVDPKALDGVFRSVGNAKNPEMEKRNA